MFEGVRVVELAEWTLVPAAAAVLAQFGADVIKVERPVGGDMQRGLAVTGQSPAWNGISLQMQQTNFGGKRSVGIDVRTPEGRELLYEMLRQADVFVTSMRAEARTRLGVDEESVRELNESIVYALGSGYGLEGEDADVGGYDMTAYWCRGGLAHALTVDESPHPVRMRPALGDKLGAMNIVAGVAGALLRRSRTGEGALVDVSLLSTAAWQVSSDLVYSANLGQDNSRIERGRNPLVAYYETQDGRWIALCLLESDRWWPRLLEAIDRTDLMDDPRFTDHAGRQEHFEPCVAELTRTFAERTFEAWKETLGQFRGPWAPVVSPLELASDPQALANGYIHRMSVGDAGEITMVPSPIQVDGNRGRLDPCPEPGQHTEEVMLEMGHGWDEILHLKDAGTIN